jgi:hypothetical protein
MDECHREPGLLKAGTKLLLNKSPMSSSPKLQGILVGLGRGVTRALAGSRLMDRC